LLVHGALHAQGWDHEDDGEAADMQALEAFVLATLGIADPYDRANRRATSRAK
jgi:probable rRNA maturation factor